MMHLLVKRSVVCVDDGSIMGPVGASGKNHG
jgi:hypothetical protein